MGDFSSVESLLGLHVQDKEKWKQKGQDTRRSPKGTDRKAKTQEFSHVVSPR